MARSRRRSSRGLRRNRAVPALVALAFGVLLFVGTDMFFVLTANVTVAGPKTLDTIAPVQPDGLRPSECVDQGISVARVISGGTTLNGANDGDLLLAGDTTTDIVGGSGNDCIVGGSAANIDGGGGTDVCIGSATTTFTNCEYEVRQ